MLKKLNNSKTEKFRKDVGVTEEEFYKELQ